MRITSAQIAEQAQKGNWYFDCTFDKLTGDSVVIMGDGVDDLNRLDQIMQGYPRGMFTIDVGLLETNPRSITREDVAALRSAYVTLNGTVSKPPLVEDRHPHF